ncbi:hypothetical protein COV06_01045 [Candidatus Uhrbacteria bacterium CG10_big_fil_rev_8_21_14_0_10_50_16]|uniref:Maf-like protein n=1 Tax=Candidatus Uhrbacteria bacterium CG10_big_fil_rev_8_21_14_0_10_50_16 TaxID=1975039 RepID=A0A2H0RNC2_9BACT|nr:MAG: hypothetical protein COV06_01045 [Candidatus Uhrbacteria bacterium CG10_big_fil_rev_8_21_14_0_10_50_16]
MRLVICGSLTFVKEMDVLKTELDALGHETIVPLSADLVRAGDLDLAQLEVLKQAGQHHTLSIQYDAIRTHYKKIAEGDAVLVTNIEKNGVPGYIGGNTFLEMGFAHVLNKPIFVLYPLPNLTYTDEMLAMQPTVLNGNLNKITLHQTV